MNRPTKCQRLFVKKPRPKSATTSCRHAGPKPCPEKNCLEKDDTHVTVYLSCMGSKNEPINAKRVHGTLGRQGHAWNVTWGPTWPLAGQGIQHHVGTRYPHAGTTAGTTSAPKRCHINVYPRVRVHTCQKEGDRGQEHKSRVWHSKKLSFSLLSVSRADHDFTAPLTGALLRCNNAPSCPALNVPFKVLSYFCQIKRHAFYPTKRWRFSSKKCSDMPWFFRRNLCQIWAYNESSHPLVPPKNSWQLCQLFLDQAKKKQTILAVNVCAKIGRKTATMKNQIGNDLSKLSFWKSTVKTIHWLFRHENAVLFFNIQDPCNQIGTYVQRDVSQNMKRENKRVRLDRRTENQSLLSE